MSKIKKGIFSLNVAIAGILSSTNFEASANTDGNTQKNPTIINDKKPNSTENAPPQLNIEGAIGEDTPINHFSHSSHASHFSHRSHYSGS